VNSSRALLLIDKADSARYCLFSLVHGVDELLEETVGKSNKC